MRKALALLITLAIVLLSGCDAIVVTAKGPEEIQEADALVRTGIYVWESGKYLVAPFIGASFEPDRLPEDVTDFSYRYIWIPDESFSRIPVVYDDEGSGLIYVNIKELPGTAYQDLTLEKFEDRGYTIGVRMSRQEDVFAFNTKDMCNGSSAAKVVKDKITTPNAFVLSEVNDVSIADTQSLWDVNGVITDLEPNAKYMFSGFQGTAYRELIIQADVRYFVSNGTQDLSSDMIETTKKGFFVVHLPDDLTPGLYCIAGSYLFYYDVRPVEQTTETSATKG